MERNYRIGQLFLGVVVLVWGANFGIVKSAYQDLPPIPFAALRFTLSGIPVLIFTFWREKGLRIRKEDLGRVAAVGALGLGLYQILWSVGLNLTSATNSALILSTQPLIGALYVDLIEKEPVGKRKYLNMLLAFGGVTLVILRPGAGFGLSFSTFSGDLLTLMAGFCATVFFSAWSKPLLKIYSPLRLMGYCMIISSIVLWAAALFLAQPITLSQVGAKAWWSLGYAVVFSGIVGHVLWYDAIGRIGVTKTMVYVYFIPVWAVVFNFLLMGERIYPQQILGGVLILLGVHRVLRT